MTEYASYENVTIRTIDNAIRDWFDKTVDAHVESPTSKRKKVTVVFASGERWATSRTRKGLRDAKGVLILPVISVRRSAIEPSPTMAALGTETPTLQISKVVSGKTRTLMNLENVKTAAQKLPTKPIVYEVSSIPFPDRSIFNYEIIVHAQYISQMNAIIEKIFHELDLQKSFVAPFRNDGRHPPISEPFESRKQLDEPYVVGFFQSSLSDGGNFEEFTDQERIVKWSTSIMVPSTLQLDPEGEKPAVTVERTAFKTTFGDESVRFVDDPLELEIIFGKGR